MKLDEWVRDRFGGLEWVDKAGKWITKGGGGRI